MPIKPKNQIYSDIIGFIAAALSNFNIESWQIMQLEQPVKITELKPTIYVSIPNRNRIGWQGRKYPKINDELKIQEKLINQFDCQISAVRTRKLTDTKETLNSVDVLELIKAHFLNPNTIVNFRKAGYRIFQPTTIQNQNFIDDSDNFEFMPFFNVSFILDETLITAQAAIDDYTLRIERLQ